MISLIKKIACLLIFTLLFCETAFSQVNLIPIMNLELYGGQFFFEGENTSFAGNASWVLSPGLKLSEDTTILPVYSGTFRKTREVQELVGGGFLTQKLQDHIITVKGIHKFRDEWKGKAKISYKKEYLCESNDEDWGDGLFDYDKYALGFEAEKNGDIWKSLYASVDFYTISFPNFKSLASQKYGSEINTGEDVLDFDAMDISGGAYRMMGEKMLISGNMLVSRRLFKDQKIVEQSGTYSGSEREDTFLYLSLGLNRSLPDTSLIKIPIESVFGFKIGHSRLNSDQNNYDAQKTRFNADYYDYSEWQLGPSIDLRLFKKYSFGLGYEYQRRSYSSRPVQDTQGNYQDDTINADTSNFIWSLGYPFTENLSLNMQGVVRSASSNMDYEKVYRYTYSSSHYFVGVSYKL